MILFAHGAGGNRLSWWQQVPYFMDSYSCVTFSHPGFGRSVWIGDVSERISYSDVLLELLDHLEIERAVLVAQSMGGWICLPVAVRLPERVAALFMASTPGNMRTPEIDQAREANRERVEELRQAGEERSAGSFHPALGERCFTEQPGMHYLYSAIQGLNQPRVSRPGIDITPEEMSGYRTPTVYITGKEDVVLPSPMIAAAAAVTPGADLELVPETGHSIYFERPDVFNSLLSDFLSKVYPS
ncbi:MAG TPA: alpha/beta hydrolase [Dehalococcoidia bacterium]|nr:alpha/beta hydrolase [Dehalococcoidia bacterium]